VDVGLSSRQTRREHPGILQEFSASE